MIELVPQETLPFPFIRSKRKTIGVSLSEKMRSNRAQFFFKEL